MAYNAFLSTFVHLYNQCCPIRLVKHFSCKNDKPWLTNSLRNACHKFFLLYNKFLRSRTLTAEQKYKLYKNKLTTILRFAEKSYYSSLLVANRGDAKNTWNVLNTVINKKMCQLPKHFECNGEDVSDTSIIANKFNTFFATIGPNLANALPAVEGASIGDYMGEHNINSMFLTPVVENEIINIVKLCKPQISKDCVDISMYVISKVIVSIAKPLAHIFNLSFSCGIFPDHMKIAKIIPIFKNGQKTEFTNYRPISILSQFSKILEKLFNLRLDKFLDANKILSNSQYGFRPGMSTVHAAAELVNKFHQLLMVKVVVQVCLLDLKKAFDTVDHELLVATINVYGIRGIANKWLQNYLTHRKQ